MFKPLVSVGMPVHNSKPELLSLAMQSLLTQDCGDFEIILSDNASGSESEALYRHLASKDSRIRYVRHETMLTVVDNFRFTAEEARGEFFFWAADDDLRAPTFIARMLGAFKTTPAAVLASSRIVSIDESGTRLSEAISHPDAGHPSVVRRVATLRHPGFYLDIYGMYRRNALRSLDLPRWDYWGWDTIIVFEMLLRGPIARVDEDLFFYRVRQNSNAASLARFLVEQGSADRDPRMNWERDRSFQITKALLRSSLSPFDKVLSFALVAIILRRSPYVDERRRLMRHRYYDAIGRGDYLRASQAAAIYVGLSPLAPFRLSAWRGALSLSKDD
jgi:glycosyltransferase involved in cell wall biosynthesis